MDKIALVVDDSMTFRQMVSMALSEARFKVIEAGNGREALDRLNAGGPRVDIIISDINMPQMDGITFVKHARELPAVRTVPILMLTTESMKELRQQAKAAGATGWIVKPFNAAQLITVVKDLLP